MSRTRKLVLFLAGLALGSLLVEAMLRIGEAGPWWRVVPLVEASFYGPDPVAGFAHRPNASGVWLTEHRARQAVSHQGLLDRSYAEAPPAGTWRVAVLGDSIVEALQVERRDSFQRLTEALLAPDLGSVEVMNAGVSGATPAVIAARLETHALKYRPDAVVILLPMGDFLSAGSGYSSPITEYEDGGNNTIRRGTAFRDSFGYRFRTGSGGDVFYFLLAHVRLAGAINARLNAGLFQDLTFQNTPAGGDVRIDTTCQDIAPHLAVWQYDAKTFASRRASAFIEDIANQLHGKNTGLIVAMQGLNETCARNASHLIRLATLLQRRFAENHTTVSVVDWDAVVTGYLAPAQTLRSLRGFGASQGNGHLNHSGHSAYAAALAGILKSHFANKKLR